MSVSERWSHAATGVVALCGFLACSGAVLAADEEPQPDLELLEYLGSWEESDEEWLLFGGAEPRRAAADGAKEAGPDPEVEESAELNDES